MTKKWILSFLFVLASVSVSASTSIASDFPKSAVPDPLKSWIPWVLDEVPNAGCPHLFNDAANAECAWPAVLDLKVSAKGAIFSQDVNVYHQSWFNLPGDEQQWPEEVTVDGKPVAVISKDGLPLIALAIGAHHIAGRFAWASAPESLALPAHAGLLRLDLNGQLVTAPVRDESNRVWLQRKVAAEGVEQVQLKVARKVNDGVPMTVTTRFHLDVSGKGREIILGRALLPELIPQELLSALPASLTQDGNLTVQARAGTWDITFVARHPGQAKALTLPSGTGILAEDEVWVFEAAPLIRTTSIEGPTSIDTQQLSLPDEWRSLPGYLMRPNSQFGFKEIRRGDSDPAPDKLSLARRLWLSFDGKSMTMSDVIQGEVSRAARLNMSLQNQLGRVDIDGRDLQITSGSDKLAGVEVKRGALRMTADSLMGDALRSMPVVGWQHDFDKVGIELNLPAGWRLFHASGTDRAQGAWISRWNLLDFFVVLVIALAAGHLWGRKWGALALFALILSYQEPDAPRFSWMVLLALVAIVRALPDGRLLVWMNRLKQLSLLSVVLISLHFATAQVRGALYPVLERDAYLSFDQQDAERYAGVKEVAMPAPAAAPVAGMQAEVAEIVPAPALNLPPGSPPMKGKAMAGVSSDKLKSMQLSKVDSSYRTRNDSAIDPDAKVQTGPGLPQWRWRSYQLVFDGPVRQDQQLHLWLISPWVNKLLVLLQLILLGMLLACVADVFKKMESSSNDPSAPSGHQKWNIFKRFGKNLTVLGFALVIVGATLHTSPVQAQLPNPEQLQALKEKLLRPADCLPECAEISRLSVQVIGPNVRLGLEIDAAIDTALPLPGGAKHWMPNEARLDGKPAYVHRDESGALWLLAPAGRHRVELNGALMLSDTLQLPLARKPRHVEVIAEGWDVAGLSEESGAADTLQLSRRVKASAKGDKSEAPALPAFLQVTRRLVLDKEWTVHTTVARSSPLGVPALANIPVLPGESVTTAGMAVKDGKVLVNLGPQADSISWDSTVNQATEISLSASKDSAWTEFWVIDSSNAWHIKAQGIPPVAADVGGAADLSFRPWPGETLKISIERPQAIPGQTMTIDESRLVASPGARATDYLLTMNIRSSRGLDYSVLLPEGAVLQRVTINQQQRPIRASGRQLVLPLVPGTQKIDIAWRVDQGMAVSYSSLSPNLNTTSVNHFLEVNLPHERWLLLTSGPGVGPAILFWGKLIILLAVALALGRFGGLPMRTRHWILLALGLTQVAWWGAVLVIAWFFAFSSREKVAETPSARWLFNLRQVILVLLTVAMLGILLSAVEGGLLGQPDMQVAGNQSSANNLHWYLDRSAAELPIAWTLSLPMLVYRGLMLLWALWLAWSLLSWLKWGWNALVVGGLWKRKPIVVATAGASDSASASDAALSSTPITEK